MDNLSLYTQINNLPANLKEQVRDFVEFLKMKSDKQKRPIKKREFGILKGKVTISKDFDAPIADFNDYM
ncbi:DUF2281 domain-containing protein [Echinicola marina]|uniref:type II toxin-antitoxin system VapB family antitoxin n=1 Tax=Echinicola marina TaxID=2859768 RepID=UPI001CF6E835|nr:DUF2281 domain-containing protein [Echinicola marina]UCS91971.1 DUF2281 domain-containing protein [Echinicola marina]UCS91975.1 DUF2281 domain-containing protein [Echinicola marina]